MPEKPTISRRDICRGAVMIATVAVLPATVSGDLLAQAEKAATPVKPPENPPQKGEEKPAAPEQQLSAAGQAEAQQSYQAVMQKYGSRFTDEQKKDIQRLLLQQQQAIEKVRAFPLENGDEPATVLHFFEPEVKRANR